MRAPNWAWPNNVRENPTFLVRTGRVLHWLALIFAAAITGAGIWLTANGIFSPPPTNYFDRFDGQHAGPPIISKPMSDKELDLRKPLTSKQLKELNDVLRAGATNSTPYVSPVPPFDPRPGNIRDGLAIIAAAAIMAMIGRALRHLFAGE